MDIVDTIVNVLVLAAVGGLLSLQMHGVRKELAEHRRENREDFAQIRAELTEHRRENRDELAGIRGELGSEIAGLRSDLTQVALAVGAKRRASGGN